ncbi:MAG: sensor histidine kinase KdpD [Candidatus Kapaibacterium sp.]|nr:MAG: sensor histidine kinase KdpD [Candidatus Kapabacteria bacterium]
MPNSPSSTEAASTQVSSDSLSPEPPSISAEEVLEQLQKEEAEDRRGKLKVFFGMCAGVGKTYAMLQEAHERKREGKDVVLGFVATARREDIQRLAQELESISYKNLTNIGPALEEPDIDAILVRKPDIVLLDDLAHTNTPGTRHAKRFQDVQELLDNGINVFTTLNVQNLESRIDTIRQITGVEVRETVPDSFLEEADDIELIDIAPDELLQRLAEGKIYPPEQVPEAANSFFRKGNLTALREMALRLTAERVDQELREILEEEHNAETWKSGERLMVAVGPSPFSKPLVRWTRRLAYTMDAPWIAISVETSKPLSEDARGRLSENLALAKELGAEIITTVDDDLVSGIVRSAKEHNVSQIIVGKPFAVVESSLKAFKHRLFGSSKTFIDRLIAESGTIDIYAVRVEEASQPGRKQFTLSEFRSQPKQYAFAGALALVFALGVELVPNYILEYINYHTIGMILLCFNTILALYFGRGPVIFAGLVGALLWNFLFIPPRFSFGITHTQDGFMFALYVLISLVMGVLTSRIKTQERAVRQREERTSALYQLAKDLAAAPHNAGVLERAAFHVGKIFKAKVVIFANHEEELLDNSIHAASTAKLSENEQDREYSTAAWVFANQKNAGRFTSTFPNAEAYYTPLSSPRAQYGVLGVVLGSDVLNFTIDQQALLESFVSQISSALERGTLSEETRQLQLEEEAERLHSTLINSITNELRTPIREIMEATGDLRVPELDTAHTKLNASQKDALRKELTGEIEQASMRLTTLAANLLNMTRIQAGKINLHLEWHDVSDLIGVAMARLRRELANHIVRVEIPNEFPQVKMDFVLMEQALVNLVQNAVHHTPQETPIKIIVGNQTTKERGHELVLTVADGGQGLPSDELSKIFDKFYRASGNDSEGLGLSLAITKGLVESHKGTIAAQNRKVGGMKFIITLPMNDKPPAGA